MKSCYLPALRIEYLRAFFNHELYIIKHTCYSDRKAHVTFEFTNSWANKMYFRMLTFRSVVIHIYFWIMLIKWKGLLYHCICWYLKKKKRAELKSILPSRMAAFNERLITKEVLCFFTSKEKLEMLIIIHQKYI